MRKIFIFFLVAIAISAGAAHAGARRAVTLSPNEAKHLQEMMANAEKNRAAIKKFHQQQTRALRGKRLPRSKK